MTRTTTARGPVLPDTADGHVLPDDVSIEDLAARAVQPGPNRRASSTAKYNDAMKKWWPKFCAAARWDPVDKLVFLNSDGSIRDGTFRQLFIWLFEQEVSKGIFKPMLAWAQSALDEQLSAAPHGCSAQQRPTSATFQA